MVFPKSRRFMVDSTAGASLRAAASNTKCVYFTGQVDISNGRAIPLMTYLDWVVEHTAHQWWHDSADRGELELGRLRVAIGVTTNPVLAATALKKNRERWRTDVDRALARRLPAEQKAETLMEIAVTRAAEQLLPAFRNSSGRNGFVCAQVNPVRAADRDCMYPMAKRFHAWAPNIAVKLPATAAGLDVLQDCG